MFLLLLITIIEETCPDLVGFGCYVMGFDDGRGNQALQKTIKGVPYFTTKCLIYCAENIELYAMIFIWDRGKFQIVNFQKAVKTSRGYSTA